MQEYVHTSEKYERVGWERFYRILSSYIAAILVSVLLLTQCIPPAPIYAMQDIECVTVPERHILASQGNWIIDAEVSSERFNYQWWVQLHTNKALFVVEDSQNDRSCVRVQIDDSFNG